LYAKTGRDFLARVNYDMVEKTARDATDFDRELALFYCDHDRQLPRALDLARRDLGARKDIFAYDALAWALYKNDRPAEAEPAMTICSVPIITVTRSGFGCVCGATR